jgi:hypothetical protein
VSKLDDAAEILRGPVGWIVVGVVVIGAAYYLFGKAKTAISNAATSVLHTVEAPFVAAGQAVSDGATAYTSSLTANEDATGNDVVDSVAVGMAGGG